MKVKRKEKHIYIIKLKRKEAECLRDIIGTISDEKAEKIVVERSGKYITNFVDDLFQFLTDSLSKKEKNES